MLTISIINSVCRLDVTKDEGAPHIETPKVDARIKEATAALNKQMATRPPTPAQQISGSFRAQSASLNRPRVTPARPVKSAGSKSRTTQATSTVSIEYGNSSTKNAQQTAKGQDPSYFKAEYSAGFEILNLSPVNA